jgi:hypothetical protein
MLIALKFGWSKAEIMSLPLAEFEFYANKLAEYSKPTTK